MENEKKIKKRKIKKLAIFNLISILIVLFVGTYYLGRLIYFKIDSEKEITYSNILFERIKQSDSSPYSSKKHLIENNGTLQYVDDIDNNYVRYKGFLWRIVRINPDNSITMITEDTITYLSYNDIFNWLNKSDDEYTGIFDSALNSDKLLNTKQCFDIFSNLDNSSCEKTNNDYKIGLLSINDYKNANANESYLNNGTSFWTTNNVDENNGWIITSDGLIENVPLTSKVGLRPTITINGNIEIITGSGIADDPYIIEERDTKKLNDAYVGEYINFNNLLWKVVKVDENVKVVSDECIKDENNICLSMKYSNFSNKFDEKNKENLLYYLNNTYYDSIKNQDMMISGNFYTGTYSLLNNNYKTCMENEKKLDVGLLSIADIFAFDMENTLLLTTSPDNEFSIYSVKDDHTLYENSITELLNIRPSIYLKGDISISSGDGTYVNPYKIEGDTNE